MSRLFLGNLDGVGPVVKIMANDTDDPRTTPNTDWWKFRFNSETAEIGYVQEVGYARYNSWDFPTDSSYVPSGTDIWTCYLHSYYKSLPTYFYARVNTANLFPGSADFINWMGIDAVDWVRLYYGTRVQYFTGGGADYLYWFSRVEPFYTSTQAPLPARMGVYELSGGTRYAGRVLWNKPSAGVVTNTFFPDVTWGSTVDGAHAAPDNRKMEIILYQTDLPIDETPYPAVTGTPSAGKKIVRIDENNAKIAKPGFDVDSATDAQLIVGHDKPPLLVARTGTFTLAPGAQQNVNVALPITTKSLVDYQVNKTGHDLYLPAYPDNDADELNIQYRIVGQQVQFKNPSASASFDVRFFVMAADELSTTTGSAKVLDTSGDKIQLLRPGSATTPNARDILLDSRATYLPMIAQDYVDVSEFSGSGSYLGNLVYRVNLPAGDYKPFVLARSKNAVLAGTSETGETFYADFYGKQLSVYSYMSSSTFLAHVTGSYVDFYANSEARSEDVWRYETSYRNSAIYNRFKGMRYYIFAVPNSL